MINNILNNSLSPSFTFSQSSLQDFVDCARRFKLRYIDQLHWPAVDSEPVLENERRQHEGQEFHRLVQQHLIGLPAEKLSPLANSTQLSRWWENYLHTNFDLEGAHKFIEFSLSSTIGKFRLVAKYDLVTIHSGGKVIIYDWKTSQKRPRDESMAGRIQSHVYPLLLIQAGTHLNAGLPIKPDDLEMIYWYADFPTEPTHFPYDSAHFKRDSENLTGLINEIFHHQHFPLTDDIRKCSYCSYRSYCNRGIEAGSDEETAEDELSEGGDSSFEQIAEIEY